jgi:hypothetical protein
MPGRRAKYGGDPSWAQLGNLLIKLQGGARLVVGDTKDWVKDGPFVEIEIEIGRFDEWYIYIGRHAG